jgi:hypothetical protein
MPRMAARSKSEGCRSNWPCLRRYLDDNS